MKLFKDALAVGFLILALLFLAVTVFAFLGSNEEDEGSLNGRSLSALPSLDGPGVTSDEVQDMVERLPAPEPLPGEIPLGEAVSAVHNDPDMSANSKADAAISLARDRVTSLSKEEVEDYAEVVITNFQNRSIVTNPDKLFLLQQVYLGAALQYSYEEGSTGNEVGFDYMQIARDLYRDTATPDDDFIQANLRQIEKALSN